MNLKQMKELEADLLGLVGQIRIIDGLTRGDVAIRDIAITECESIIRGVQGVITQYEPRITKVYFETNMGARDVFVTVNDGHKREHLLKHYPDEWTVYSEELLGKTIDQARDLCRRRDIAYVQGA